MTNTFITWITFVDFCLTLFPHVSDVTLAEEVINFILAGSIVFAWINLSNRTRQYFFLERFCPRYLDIR